MSAPIVETVGACRAALEAARRDGRRIGLVPTMGALHEGHLTLVDAAREAAGHVVVSIFVNPLQFDSAEDLATYPRDLEADARKVSERGADLVFAPSPAAMYPEPPLTRVTMRELTDRYEGAARPGHFDGVLTVVSKLFHVVEPDVAVFGRKDAQQAAAVARMVADLDFDVEIVVGPTVREADGLALSSRNVRLSAADRERARALSRALFEARDRFRAGEADPGALERGIRDALSAAEGVEPEYAAVVDRDRFTPVERIDRPCVAVTAARVGGVRLIDNVVLDPSEAP